MVREELHFQFPTSEIGTAQRSTSEPLHNVHLLLVESYAELLVRL
jgi:hypothetical protein